MREKGEKKKRVENKVMRVTDLKNDRVRESSRGNNKRENDKGKRRWEGKWDERKGEEKLGEIKGNWIIKVQLYKTVEMDVLESLVEIYH